MCKPKPIFAHMPFHIKLKIVGFADYISRFRIRKCSKELQSIVDKSKFDYKLLVIYIGESAVTLRFQNTFIDYSHGNVGPFGGRIPYVPEDGIEKYKIEGPKHYFTTSIQEGYIERALADFATFIKSPKCSVNRWFLIAQKHCQTEKLWTVTNVVFPFLNRYLESLNRKLAVTDFRCCFSVIPDDLLQILPHLQPGYLEIVVLAIHNAEVARVAALEQWKRARSGVMHGAFVPLTEYLHFRQLKVREYSLQPHDVEMLIERALLITDGDDWFYEVSFPAGYDTRIAYMAIRDYPKLNGSDEHRVIKMTNNPYHLLITLNSDLIWFERIVLKENDVVG